MVRNQEGPSLLFSCFTVSLQTQLHMGYFCVVHPLGIVGISIDGDRAKQEAK